MKQHITKEQWDEVSNHKKLEFIPIMSKTAEIGKDSHPNIGQMIEFLGDYLLLCLAENPFEIEIKDAPTDVHFYLATDYYGLCDGLWSAVKRKMED